MVKRFENATRSDQIIEALDKIHFVFRGRGDLGGAENMLKAMREKGESVLRTHPNGDVVQELVDHLYKQIRTIEDSLESTKLIPEPGDLVVFQGKDVPYSI